MTSLPKEKLPSIEELRATLFEIPKSLQKLLEKPIGPTSWGPLTNQEDPNVELNSELVANSVAESLRKQQQQLKVTDAGGLTLEPSSVIELNLDGENISSLGRPPYPLMPLSKLRLLVLSNNRLNYDIPASAMNNIRTLLPGTTSAAFAAKTTSNNLLNNNNNNNQAEIQKAALSVLPELRELQLDHNLFTTFPTITHAKLEMLNLSNNDIHHFEPLSLPKLEYLDISGNRHFNLPSLAKSKWTCLVTLDVSRCEVDSLVPIGQSLTNLRSLDCHGNKLTNLQGIEPLIHLEFLDASHNFLKHSRLQKAVAVGVTSTGNPLASCAATLQELHLQHNGISTVNFFPPCGMKSLWKLILSDNPLGGSALVLNSNSNSNAPEDAKQASKIRLEDDIGDAKYDDNENDDDDDAKSGITNVSRRSASKSIGNPTGAAVVLAKKTSKVALKLAGGASTNNVNNNNNNNNNNNSLIETKKSAAIVSSTGIASKLASLFPQLECLDLARTGVVSSKAELNSVCSELSRGCVYLRELELPLPPSSSSLQNNNNNGDDQSPKPNDQDDKNDSSQRDRRSSILEGSEEEAEIIQIVADQMKCLSRFNGYLVRDDAKVGNSFIEDQKTVESQAELKAALEELESLEHLMDEKTMAMLKDFTIETTVKKNDLLGGQRDKLMEELGINKNTGASTAPTAGGKRPASARLMSSTNSINNINMNGNGGGGNQKNLDRPASAGAGKRPGSASGSVVKSSIPKPRPVVHGTGIPRSVELKMQRDREDAKIEFEGVLGEISQSRVVIENTLDHVTHSLETLGVAPRRKGSPFKEIEKKAEAAKVALQKQQQTTDQKNRFNEAAERYAEKAPALTNVPRPPPKTSKATAENARLLEKFTAESEKIKLEMQMAEHHVRTAVHPSAPHGISSSTNFHNFNNSNSAASVSTRTNTTIIGSTTPSMMTNNKNNNVSPPLGMMRKQHQNSTSEKKKSYVDDSSSSDDDDNAITTGRNDRRSENLIKKIVSASTTMNNNKNNSSTASPQRASGMPPATTGVGFFDHKRGEEPMARVSKWSTERKEPLSVRLAKISDQFNNNNSARTANSNNINNVSPARQEANTKKVVSILDRDDSDDDDDHYENSPPSATNMKNTIPPNPPSKTVFSVTSTKLNNNTIAPSPFAVLDEAFQEQQQQQQNNNNNNNNISVLSQPQNNNNNNNQQQQPKISTFKAGSLNARRR